MVESEIIRFIYFSLKSEETIKFNEKSSEFIQPRHPETNELDFYYLQSMLKYFNPSRNIFENEILDAFPVISLTKDKNNKFYKLSLYRLREFSKNLIEEDEYIQASVKHLFMYSLLASPTNKSLQKVIQGCLERATPVMYRRDQADTVDGDSYDLRCLASYVPTDRYRVMKLLRGWIEGALHFYGYSIMFFDKRFVGFEDFNENIIDLKTKDLFMKSFYGRVIVNIHARNNEVKLEESELYYKIPLSIYDLKRDWLFTSPNNDNERDGKVMMFRNKDLQCRLQEILGCLFPRHMFRINDVLKWNRYSEGGKFNSHYDTMFVQKSSEECSLYTLLIYLEVEGDSFMYLYGEKELQVQLKSDTAYIIPHWVKHRVEGEGAREFIKAEIVFKNQYFGISYDRALADAFDQSCYYMLQSVRHPEFKDIVSKNFNTINEARFYETKFVPKLINNIYLGKTICKLPFEYYHKVNGDLIRTCDIKFNFFTDGTNYYFKINTSRGNSGPVVSRNEAFVMLCLMQLDIQPKKLYQRLVNECQCTCRCTDYNYSSKEFDIVETIFYWTPNERDSLINDAIDCIKFPSDMGTVYRVGNISSSDIPSDPETFYFAACQNVHPCIDFYETLLTEITSCDQNYKSLNVDFIGKHGNIVKIRQHSFKNGVVVRRRWVKD